MGGFASWLSQNWFTLIQSLGIIGSLGLATAALRRETQARRLGHVLTLAGHHRELWSEAHRRADLRRVFLPEVDLVSEPVSQAEEEYLKIVIVHFHTGWELARTGTVHSLDVVARDAQRFFSLPLPRLVWESSKQARESEFVRFVDESLRQAQERKVPCQSAPG